MYDRRAMGGIRFTEYRGRGFFCRDGLLEVWLAIVVDELDGEAGLAPDWLARLRDDFRAQATVVFDGLMETRLDPHLTSEARRQRMVSLCHRVAQRLHQRHAPGRHPGLGRENPMAESLAARVGGRRWSRGDTIAGLSRINDSFIWLLEAASAMPSA